MGKSREEAKEILRDDLRKIIRENREAFLVDYAAAMAELKGLSADQLATIVPGVAGSDVYDRLKAAVAEATQKNEESAALKDRIVKLGQLAIEIAKKVPTLAALFAV
jgi:hypothetical protein